MSSADSPTLLCQSLESALLAECAKLKALMRYDETAGFYFWPNVAAMESPDYESQCGICTNGAKRIAQKFGGYVAGYLIHPEDPRTLVGADVYGHDFAVVGDFMVDWWGWEYAGALEIPVISRAKAIAFGKYKPAEAWEVHPDHDFREQFWRGGE
jgi:hypothetical protein